MKTYLISYDLNKAGQDYSELFAAIKAYKTWWHHLDSTWIIRTDQTASQIRDNLASYIDGNDELFVVRLSGESAWKGFNSKGSDWLKTHMK